ncbi:hypothetical protein LI328DRAFT_132962 [Trichoderma asperelloides]|nr:hypothetical protein LI328DRAFT_132962 [Trichoderma asperelloides]
MLPRPLPPSIPLPAHLFHLHQSVHLSIKQAVFPPVNPAQAAESKRTIASSAFVASSGPSPFPSSL